MRRIERSFVEAERAAVKAEASAVPRQPEAFETWFEALAETPRDASRALAAWLASEATDEQRQWFADQERAHDANFDDLLALTRVNMPEYSKGGLVRLCEALSHSRPSPLFQQRPTLPISAPPIFLWQALAVNNLMVALATAPHYVYHSLAALGLIEDLGVPGTFGSSTVPRPAFSRLKLTSWSREVLTPLVVHDSSLAPLIAEGALMRLRLVARRDASYLHSLKHSSALVAQFEYAEDSPSKPSPLPMTESDSPSATCDVSAASVLRPVRWPDVSARSSH